MTCAYCGHPLPADAREPYCCASHRRRIRGARALPLALLVLAGCHLHHWLAGKPDLTAPSGPVVYWNGRPPVPGVVDEIERVHAVAVRSCADGGIDQFERHWRSTEIRWMPDPFDCGSSIGPRWVHGCEPGSDSVLVGSAAVIPDELGHIWAQDCRGGPGEKYLPDGGALYLPWFVDFLSEARP